MSKEIVVIGAGAVAAELSMYIDALNIQSAEKELLVIKGFLDDSEENFNVNAGKYNFTKPYLGKVADYSVKDDVFFVFGFANPNAKKIILKHFINQSNRFINIIHPSSQISESARLGVGNIIYPNCIVGPNVSIGNFNTFTSYSFVSHDCVVGDNNFFATAGLSGNVKLKDDNFFGIRSTVLPSITIGSANVIQAGMVIDKNILNNETVFYRYKEKIYFNEKA